MIVCFCFFFFKDTATTEIYTYCHTLSLHDALPICRDGEGNPARDLRLAVRLRVSSEYSELSLASKFGCDLTEAPRLLQQARQHCDWLGVCFHVGSQAMSPFAFVQALDRTRAAIAQAGVVIDMIDVGGGFPSIYPGLEPPAMEDYFAIIARHFEALPIAYNAELWCEPGRALCAEYSSLIVRVERRRGDRSEEQTSELQSLMRISYAVFCLKTKKKTQYNKNDN